jgi:hypothetical protein
MLSFAIETAAGSDRQYLAGSPFVDAAVWSREEPGLGFAMVRKTRVDGDRCSETLDFMDEGQQAVPTTFTSRRTYDNSTLAMQALATLPAAHRWAGTAVALIQSAASDHQWHVFKAAGAVLTLVNAQRQGGSTVLVNYQWSVGAWVEQETLFDDEA